MCAWILAKAQSNLPSEAIISQFQDGRAYAPKINTNALIARNTSWAFSAIRWNANSVAMPILRLFVAKPTSISKSRFPTRAISKERRDFIETKATVQQRFAGREIEEVLQHPLIELLQRVNGQMETFELRYLTEQSKETTGNAFWWKVRNNLGTPEELWFLHPQFMKVVADKTRFISGFKYGRQNQAVFIPIEDIVFFRNPDVSSPVLGIGELQKAIVPVDLSNEMNTHELNLLARGGTPESVMSFPAEQTVSPDEIKRMKRDYKRKYAGTRNAGNLMISTGGAKIEKFGFNQKEMQFLGGRKWSRSEIFGVFGVPETFVDMPSVSRSNADTANTEYQRRTILPKLIMTEDTLNEQLVNEFDENLFVAFDNPVPEDKEFRLKEKQTNITIGYSTVNEERMRDGLDPIDGGDELQTPGTVPEIIEPVKRVKAIIPPLAMPAANFIPEEFTDEVQKYLKSFGNAILAQADSEAFKSVKVADPGDLVSQWFNFTVWDKRAENVMLPFIRASILLAGPKALRSIDASAQFDNSSPGVQEALSARTVSIRGMNRTLQKDTRAALAAGLDAGESVSSLRKRIGGVFGFDDRNRALRIARTETIWGLNAGAVEGYKQSGVVVAKEWSTAEDERVCQWCGPMDGKIVGLEGDYWKMGDHMIGTDGGRLNFEVENVGHPPLHPMCRCAIVPVVRG